MMASPAGRQRSISITVSGDIVYIEGGSRDRLRRLLEFGWNVNDAVSQSAAPPTPIGVRKSLVWYAMYWGEPDALRMLLSVQHPDRRVTLATLQDALSCASEHPNESCVQLLNKAVARFKEKRRWDDIDEEESRIHRELEANARREQELLNKIQQNRMKYTSLLSEISAQIEEQKTQKQRMESRLGSLQDDVKEKKLDYMQKDKQVAAALRAIGEAEKQLALAREQYSATKKRLDRASDAVVEREGKVAETLHKLQEADQGLTILECRKADLEWKLQNTNSNPSASIPPATSQSEAKLECPICADKQVSRHLQCGHCLCGDCLTTLQEQNNHCPICRARIVSVSPLFLPGA